MNGMAMKTILPVLISLLTSTLVQAQEVVPAVSTSRSTRQKISTKAIYEAKLTTTPGPSNASAPLSEKGTNPLQAIQFVQSTAEFLPGAQPALEQLVTFMRGKPTTEIELSGHTDNQGDFDQNVLLSKKRVDLVKAYLVKNGIAASRVTTRGYGPTRPVASNNSERARQLNRRVEMIVTKP